MWRSLEDKNRSEEELQRLAEEEQPGGFITDLLKNFEITTPVSTHRKIVSNL